MRSNNRTFYLAAFLLLLPTFVFAQGFQNGNIAVMVKDATGAALPGVTVTVTSEGRGTQRNAVTDSSGRANFPVLQLGTYTAESALSGFQNAVRKGNRVEADKTTEVPMTLSLAATSETITVTGQQPVVDRTNVTATTQLSNKEFEKAPIGRGYQAIVNFTPGAVDPLGAGNPQVHGATQSQNVFLFDGVDTTDTTTGTFGSNLNFEAIQEVNVQTAGMSAEYGRAQGAVINVITKSGTNQFQGSLKAIQTNDRWNAPNNTKNEVTGASLARVRVNKPTYSYAATLGGPLWKDHLWFFGAYEKSTISAASKTTTVTNEEYVQTTVTKLPVYRLTAQLTPTQTIWAAYAEDPIDGFLVDYWAQGGAPELFALTQQNQFGDKKTVQYSGVFGTNVTAEALYGQSGSGITVVPYRISPLQSGTPHQSLADGKYYNGATFDGLVDRPRKQAVVAGSYFANLGGNAHNFKAGVDWQNLKSVSSFKFPNSRLYIDEGFDVQTRAYSPYLRLDFIDAASTSEGTITSFYARDKFDVGRRLFVEAGLRYETETANNDRGTKVLDTSNLAPRFQASYDLLGTGNTILLATAGRLYQSIVQNFADQYAANPQIANYDLYVWDGSNFVFDSATRVGAGNNALNLGLNASYVDEISFGGQQQLGPTLGVGARFIHRKWSDLIDDIKTIGPNGVAVTYDNVSNAKRDYNGLELTFEKRFSNHWNLLANYTYGKTRGNHFGTGNDGNISSQLNDFVDSQCRTGTAANIIDPTIGNNGTIRCGDMDALLEGRPTWDVPHIVNMLGSYVFTLGPVNLTAGAAGVYNSGLSFSKARTMTVLNAAGGNSGQTRTYLYEGQGSDRIPSWYFLNTSLEATYRLFGVDLGAKFEIFNVTDSQKEITLANTAWCGTTANAACQTAVNNFGKATARTHFLAPRNFRVTWLARF